MKATYFLVALSCVCTMMAPTYAQTLEAQQKTELAIKLTDLMGVRELAVKSMAQCSDIQASPMSPKIIFDANPAVFGGISPQSAYWPEILDLYGKFLSKSCQAVSVENSVAFYAQAYEKELSKEDLDSAIKFFSTDAGRKYNAASTEINLNYQTHLTEQLSDVARRTLKSMERELRDLTRKYYKDPK